MDLSSIIDLIPAVHNYQQATTKGTQDAFCLLMTLSLIAIFIGVLFLIINSFEKPITPKQYKRICGVTRFAIMLIFFGIITPLLYKYMFFVAVPAVTIWLLWRIAKGISVSRNSCKLDHN